MSEPSIAAPLLLPASRSRTAWALCGCLFLAGCGARQGASPETATGVHDSEAQLDGQEGDAETGAGGEGGGYGAQPTDATAAPTLADEDAFDALTVSSEDLDTMLSAGAVDCASARQIVERICYLATRVCALLDAREQYDALDASQCAEARARCEDAEERLHAACPSPR